MKLKRSRCRLKKRKAYVKATPARPTPKMFSDIEAGKGKIPYINIFFWNTRLTYTINKQTKGFESHQLKAS
jgi:hypothetical protein